MTKPKFTPEQIDFICYQIGEWYLNWKDNLVNFPEGTHRLGLAKEQLKTMVCGDGSEKIEYRGWTIYINQEWSAEYSVKIQVPDDNYSESISKFNYTNKDHAIEAAKTVIDFLMRKQ